MLKKTAILLAVSCMLAACATSQPRIVQATKDMPEVDLTPGMATQIELPDATHVKSVVTGNPALVTAERTDNLVNLVPKAGAGTTNLIVRSVDDDGDTKLYQYRIVVLSAQ